jgi:transposase
VSAELVFCKCIRALGKVRRKLPNKPSIALGELGMLLKTILNRVYRHKGFVYQNAKFVEDKGGREVIEIGVEPRRKSKPLCSGCWQPGPGYDHLAERRYQMVPLFGFAMFLVYRPRRVECWRCGVKVEKLPWCQGKETTTTAFQWYLVFWAKYLTDKQCSKLREVLGYNLKTARAYLLTREFQGLWEYVAAGWAGKFLDGWLTKVMHSRIEPLKKVARTLRKHRDLILNWFKARAEISAGIVEGQNYNVKLLMRRS